MPVASAAALIDAIRKLGLLTSEQLASLDRQGGNHADARSLAKDLVQRSWLTSYQINQLSQGRGNRCVRGGAFNDANGGDQYLRVTTRGHQPPSSLIATIGFRVV